MSGGDLMLGSKGAICNADLTGIRGGRAHVCMRDRSATSWPTSSSSRAMDRRTPKKKKIKKKKKATVWNWLPSSKSKIPSVFM
ncbi:hypothetical protein CsatB_012361 [Cannabis sativa]